MSQKSGKIAIGTALPGIFLSGAVALLGYGTERLEIGLFHQAWFESLVLAILIGTIFRTLFGLHPRFAAGVNVSGKLLLEIAIVLLGASVSLSAIGKAGLPLFAGIVASVVIAISFSYMIGRGLRLDHRLAMLVACGNSICGNSAIVAVAPVIRAEAEEVAASIAFTAALGIVVVLVLPFIQHMLGLTAVSYGILSGMTVYAVPQVLAATAPAGLVSMQTGTLVKLIRVLMLAPVVFTAGVTHGNTGGHRMSWNKLVPWFIIGFLGLMGLRSADLIPHIILQPTATLATILTIISMAALGLSVDLKTILHSGGRVLLAGFLSIVILAGISLTLLHLLHLA